MKRTPRKTWAALVTERTISSYAVDGEYSEAVRLLLLRHLYAYCTPDRRGKETRIIIRANVVGVPAQLRALIRFNASGAASIGLVNGGVRQSGQRSKQALQGILASQFNVTTESLAGWDVTRLDNVVKAFELVRDNDPAAVAEIGRTVLKLTSERSTTGDSTELAHFGWQTSAAEEGAFVVRAQAFELDAEEFAGSSGGDLHCLSTMTLVHEIGHSVENALYRKTAQERSRAQTLRNGKVTAYNTAFNATTARIAAHADEVDAAGSRFVNAYNSYIARPNRDANTVTRLRDQVTDIQGFQPLYRTEVAALRAARNRLHTRISEADTSPADVQSYRDAITAASQRLTAAAGGYSPEVAGVAQGLIAGLREAFLSIVPAASELSGATAAVQTQELRLERVSVPRSRVRVVMDADRDRISSRLNEFVNMIMGLAAPDRRRVIGITDYARREWPGKPGELFAEGYALWIVDRPFLQRTAPELLTYFNSGRHLQ